MKTQQFLNSLQNNLEKELIFEYAPTKWVGANYHITEIKNIRIDSVDCGGRSDSWQETVVQLWESPKEIGKRDYLKVQKSLEIFNRVNDIKPLLLNTTIKFEYGNDTFHTAQLEASDIEIQEHKLIVKLHTYQTDCKAKELCVPITKVAKEVSSCCDPATGCCS
jgi:hypothetical protein